MVIYHVTTLWFTILIRLELHRGQWAAPAGAAKGGQEERRRLAQRHERKLPLGEAPGLLRVNHDDPTHRKVSRKVKSKENAMVYPTTMVYDT